MTLDNLIEKIYIDGNAFYELKQKLELKQKRKFKANLDNQENSFEPGESKLRWMKWEITENIEKLQKLAIEEDYEFFDAPFSIYRKNYRKNLNTFLEFNLDSKESDFIQDQLKEIYDPLVYRVLIYNDNPLFYHPFIDNEDKLKFAAIRKIEFLNARLEEIGMQYDLIPHKDGPVEIRLIPNKNSSMQNLEKTEHEKLKWAGGTAQLGVILGHLAEYGFIDPPIRNNGDINYSQFAQLILNNIEVNSSPDSLSKYLNISSEKSQETQRKFKENKFCIPHIKSVS